VGSTSAIAGAKQCERIDRDIVVACPYGVIRL
jgi:hypothetical protein